MLSQYGTRINKKGFASHIWVEDLVYFDGPLVSLIKESTTQDYLYIFVDSGQLNRWLAVPVERDSLIEYREGGLSLRGVVGKSAAAYLVDIDGDGAHQALYRCEISDIPPAYLPDEDSFFDPSLCPDGNDVLLSPTRYTIYIDGSWFMEDWMKMPKTFTQLYAFIYSLQFLDQKSFYGQVRRIYSSFPWRGGFSAVHFYKSLNRLIPSLHEARVSRIQYSSPGQIDLELLSMVSKRADELVGCTSDNKVEIEQSIREIRKVLKKNKVSQLREEDPIPDLSFDQRKKLANLNSKLIFEMGLGSHQEDIFGLAGNEVRVAKIIISVYRRTEKMNWYISKGLVAR
jgi:hypothetical protein